MADWWVLGLALAGNAVVLIWGASRVSTTVDRLDKTLDKLADSLAIESRVNAVQDARLDDQERRLDQHDGDISDLRRTR